MDETPERIDRQTGKEPHAPVQRDDPAAAIAAGVAGATDALIGAEPPTAPAAGPSDRAGTIDPRPGTAGLDDAAVVDLFEQAVALHTRRLLGIARAVAGNRAAAEDVVQQALTNLFQHRARYDWANPAAAGALMRRAVVNEALRLLRQPRMSVVADEHPDARRGRDASPADPMIDRELVQKVRAAIDRLPEHFRAALVLCEYDGMAYVQIAEVLGCSIPQVKTWLHRARRQLATMLQDVAPSDARR